MSDNIRNKAVYSGIMNRWIFGANADNTTSLVFKDGYDDPTYMTFKVEFGEWGASILERKTFQSGLSEFHLTYNDYDQLPIGLLNCPYDGCDDEDIYWQSNAGSDYTVYNKTKFYSAFQYLRSRNEDTRAKYLYYFVNGLYEIQRNYPFLFKKISGISELEKFDPINGQRLKTPAKITLDCYEGLDLKIRTLMEFYRKAAWDDVYQRWILPENMREFKMIIYVFERRVFQDAKMINAANSKEMVMSYSNLNTDIPVKAYECCPCEFNIAESQSWNDSYSSGTENTEESSKIVINVKNVKTYFKNNLLDQRLSNLYNNAGKSRELLSNDIQTKIDSIMIYDLIENVERCSDNSYEDGVKLSNLGNATVNSVKALFLNKDILLENEEANQHIRSYIWGFSEKGVVSTPGLEATTANSARSKYKSSDISESNNSFGPTLDEQMIFLEDNEQYRGGWIHSLAMAPTYDLSKSFWANLGSSLSNIFTGSRKLVLISGATYIHLLQNCLTDGYYFPSDIFSPLQDKWFENTKTNTTVKNPNLSSREIYDQTYLNIENERNIDEQVFMPLDNYREILNQEFNTINTEREIPEQEYSELSNRDIPKQEFNEITKERIIPEQEFNDLSSRDIPTQQLNGLDEARQIPVQKYKKIESPRSLYDQSYLEINEPRELTKQDYNEISKERKLSEQQYKELAEQREIPEQKYGEIIDSEKSTSFSFRELDNERDLPAQQYKNIEAERSLPKQKYKEIEKERNIDSELIDLLFITRSLPGYKDISLEDVRKIPKQDLLDLKDAEERSIPKFKTDKSILIDSINKIDGSNMKLLKLDKDNRLIEDKTLEMLKQNKALSQFNINDSGINNESADEKAKKLKGLTSFIKDFSKDSEKVRNAYVANILEMKNDLRKTTIQIINNLPQNDTYVFKERELKNNNLENLNEILISQNDIDQVTNNMKFLAINDNDLEKLSFQTLITIQDGMSNALQRSHAINGLTAIVNNSVATSKKDKDFGKKSVIEEPKKDKMKVIY